MKRIICSTNRSCQSMAMTTQLKKKQLLCIPSTVSSVLISLCPARARISLPQCLALVYKLSALIKWRGKSSRQLVLTVPLSKRGIGIGIPWMYNIPREKTAISCPWNQKRT